MAARPFRHDAVSQPAATEIVSVSGLGLGTVTVTFNGTVDAALVDATKMTVDIDTGVNPAVQVDSVTVAFACGSSFVGAAWATDDGFYPGVATSGGVVV